jgi:zinc protease
MMPRVLVEENPDLPLVRVQVSCAVGGADDPPELDGLCNFAAEWMSRGAAGRPRSALDAAFDALGTSLEVLIGLDALHFEVTVLRENVERALALIADVLLRPDFPAVEADKLRREINGQIDELREEDDQLVRRCLLRTLYGAHPYGRTVLGSAETLARIGEVEARGFYRRAITTGNLYVGFAGDLTPAEAEELVARHLGGLPDGGEGGARYPDVPRRPGRRLVVCDKPERTQSQILFAQPAPPWRHPDFTALQVATCAYGGTFTARLMDEVRSQRGLSYGASARIGQGRGARALVEHVFPSLEQTAETLALVLGLHERWISDGLSPKELDFVKGYLVNSFAFAVATPEDRLELRLGLRLSHLDESWGLDFPNRVAAVTLDDTRRALATHLHPTDLIVCIVATADELLPRLEKAGLLAGFEVDVVDYQTV